LVLARYPKLTVIILRVVAGTGIIHGIGGLVVWALRSFGLGNAGVLASPGPSHLLLNFRLGQGTLEPFALFFRQNLDDFGVYVFDDLVAGLAVILDRIELLLGLADGFDD
jgi:hypothetical protein